MNDRAIAGAFVFVALVAVVILVLSYYLNAPDPYVIGPFVGSPQPVR